MIGSPLNLEMLLHAYYSAAPYPGCSKPISEGRAMLFRHGLIDCEDAMCRATEKGRFFVGHLLAVPFPVETYRIPDAGDPA
ncbi:MULTISPECIES: hypothetical protein [Sphingomonas]|jgi:hypothetical protein|uniref:Uncharacterized protein n=1 Tax=Sphingomonas aquatilis TaxID=93063 RepID=A0AAW3TSZ9_9SPHN|nr:MULTISPECIES: hypothetical protein [Sphingomonas]MBB3876067.1 hypothetical protein [Sphingomonas aquatilis]MBI0532259.1 hypothetical protein [Sphingomonas sp. TX0522]GEM70918.1 hypothetical protein SAQ01S_06840 [Sphingomonas aquatilis NBRC 16722]